MESTFDIFRRLANGDPIWIAAVKGLKEARERMALEAANSPGEYFISSRHLLAQFHDVRIRLDELQQQFTRTTDLNKRVQLTLEMQEFIAKADSLIRSLTERSKELVNFEKFRNRKSPGVTA